MITDPARVRVEPWSIGAFTASEDAGRRVVWTLLFYRERPDANPYAKPIHGLHAIVDLDDMTVVRVEDLGVVPLPPGSGAYAADRVGPRRDDLKPLEIVQPQGPSFDVRGWEVRWQCWRLRLGFTAREGLVLHTIGYEDEGRVRPVIWRASVAELFIPYADPRPYQGWRNAYDIGEFGIGIMTNSLKPGCDCLGEIRYFDVDLADGKGEPYTIRQAICLHEEDVGLLWKHFDAALQTTETRRSRRLVISFIITAGNYEYAIYWYFYQDGTGTPWAAITSPGRKTGRSCRPSGPGSCSGRPGSSTGIPRSTWPQVPRAAKPRQATSARRPAARQSRLPAPCRRRPGSPPLPVHERNARA